MKTAIVSIFLLVTGIFFSGCAYEYDTLTITYDFKEDLKGTVSLLFKNVRPVDEKDEAKSTKQEKGRKMRVLYGDEKELLTEASPSIFTALFVEWYCIKEHKIEFLNKKELSCDVRISGECGNLAGSISGIFCHSSFLVARQGRLLKVVLPPLSNTTSSMVHIDHITVNFNGTIKHANARNFKSGCSQVDWDATDEEGVDLELEAAEKNEGAKKK
ncbi:MAG: hypothetical protein PHQ23_03515 [Candidatus Wallbacteria bacterium]|nr:hypothetical protein [Candidatus Wallbacteria bacterium]